MFKRLSNPLKSNSFFLFGARGTGKTTILNEIFNSSNSIFIDLLDSETFSRFRKNPSLLLGVADEIAGKKDWIIIDEVQKAPALLDLVHKLIESTELKFALTGSSARKLKREGVNLLAGRAYVNNLFPLTYVELEDQFNLESALRWGTLPKIYSLSSDREKYEFLTSYTHSYLKEEILQEQLVRNLDPFAKFLEIASQMNGEVINYSKLAREAATSPNTVQTYFEILQDTLLGTILPAYDKSVRKQQVKSPKFYFFDCGIQRALANSLTIPVQPSTYSFGNLFESFLVNEIIRLNNYNMKSYKLSYLLTKNGAEIDLILERPGKPTALIEIKSKEQVEEEDFKHLFSLKKEFKNSECFCLSNDKISRVVKGVKCLPWMVGIEELGLRESSF